MRLEDRARVFAALQEMEIRVSVAKQKAYASEAGQIVDTLRNFKAQGVVEGRTMTEVWVTFFLKQVLAVVNAIRNDPLAPTEGSEGMVSRINDIRIYAGLLAAMCVELGSVHLHAEGEFWELRDGSAGGCCEEWPESPTPSLTPSLPPAVVGFEG